VVNLGTEPTLSIIDVSGNRRNLQDSIVEDLVSAGHSSTLVVEDKRDLGLKVTLNASKPTFSGPEYTLGENEYLLNVLITDVNVDTETKSKETKDSKGKVSTTSYKEWTTEVAFVATIANAETAVLPEKEYTATLVVKETKDSPSKSELKEQALTQAVAQLMRDITPVNVVDRVELDDEDSAQDAYIDLAVEGRVAEAIEGLSNYLKSNDKKASGHYNLAVMHDSLGQYDQAIKSYDRALELANKELYVKSRGACLARKKNTEQLK
jgi:tetratricopeptide (TPR) repeat protein